MPSTHNVIFLILAVLFICLNTYQSASVRYMNLDNRQHQQEEQSALLQFWLDRLRQQMEDDEPTPSIDDDVEHLWKRYAELLPPIRERRRFGNTRYGRSISINSSD